MNSCDLSRTRLSILAHGSMQRLGQRRIVPDAEKVQFISDVKHFRSPLTPRVEFSADASGFVTTARVILLSNSCR